MKHKLLFYFGILAASLLLLSAYLFLYEPGYSGSINVKRDHVLLFAHRGFGNHAPDNSLVGARLALQRGLDGVDVDAQFSKDRKTFIFHDVSLERFTTGEGRVDGYTFDQLHEFDLGLKYGEGTEFRDVFIESLDTFVKEITGEALLMVELKIATKIDTGMEQDVVGIISRHDVFDKVFVSAFNPIVLRRLKKIDPRVQTVFIFQDSGWAPERVAATKEEDRVSLPWYLQNERARRGIRKLLKPDALSINEHVSEEVIDKLIMEGWPIFLWPLNTRESIKWGISKEPFGIVTDEPILAKEIYDARSSD